MNGKKFEVFVEKFLVPEIGVKAVVLWDNIPADRMASIAPIIEAVGAIFIKLSPYYPDFNYLELWWSKLKSFRGMFSPKTTIMIDTLIAGSLDLIKPQYLKNWFTKCCYCHL
jgi:putative transposase